MKRRKPLNERQRREIIAAIIQNANEMLARTQRLGYGQFDSRLRYLHDRNLELKQFLKERS